ncbi:MAG: hypothetical protein IH986_14930 [Planctomycetes bacterium]|nr:hypothetical protein [Planctomycetota bacterium]
MSKLITGTVVIGLTVTATMGDFPGPGSTGRSATPQLQTLQAGRFTPVRSMARIGPDFRLKSPWYDIGGGGVAQLCSQELVFDLFEGRRNATGGPMDPATPTEGAAFGGYDPICFGPGSQARWFFGSGFHAPMTVNDFVVEPISIGATSDRVQFAWHWFVGGPGTSEQCFVAIFIAEEFDNSCSKTPTSGEFDGVILDFGVLENIEEYRWTDTELCLAGLFLQLPLDGAGAYTIFLARDYDPATGVLTPSTSAQMMLWGQKPIAIGEHPDPVVYVDYDPANFRIEPATECDAWGPGTVFCPSDNIGPMFNLYGGHIDFCFGLLCGDTNCDGLFNGGDIDAFFFALADPAQWETRFPLCDLLCAADINGDARVNGGDIDPFFRALGGNGPCNSGGG